MSHLLDAEALIDAFAGVDERVPLVAFALLGLYLAEGPFDFDASALSNRLSSGRLETRVNPEELARLQPDLERFFVPSPQGWTPRPGLFATS